MPDIDEDGGSVETYEIPSFELEPGIIRQPTIERK
jgi:hypothetical protein